MLEFVDIAHAQELDAFVLAHPNCHFMQTSAWGRVKQDWGWYGILCRDRQRNIVGSIALLRHDVKRFQTCLLYAPRGPIFSDGDHKVFSELIQGARQLAYQTGAYLLRIDPRIAANNHAFLQAAKEAGFRRNAASDYSLFQPRMCYDLCLEGMTPETLAMQYHPSTRHNMRRALRLDVTVRTGSEEELPTFCRMMEMTAEKNGFCPRDEAYFHAFLRGLGGHAALYFAESEGKILAGAISVFLGNRAWMMYCCSDTHERKTRPNELLQWKMQCDALERGCRWYDFRGVEGYPTEENPKFGLHRYKQGFGAQFREYAGQFDLPIRPVLATFISAGQRIYLK